MNHSNLPIEMPVEAPPGFDIARFFEGVYTFQRWEIFPGHVTRGCKDVAEHMRRLQVPERLNDLRVLDIAPWNGFFGFECARRGAAEVVSLGPDDPDATGYNKVKQLLRLDHCRYVRTSVYDLSPEIHGQFDVVLFLGLIYHLRHPLLALDRVYDVVRNRLFIDSPIIDNTVYDKTIPEQARRAILTNGRVMHQLPIAYFTKGSETQDPYNWFIPNSRAFRDFVESSGFTIDSYWDDGGGWASLSATKGQRCFTPGVEGWNPKAIYTPYDPPAEPASASQKAGSPPPGPAKGVQGQSISRFLRKLLRRGSA